MNKDDKKPAAKKEEHKHNPLAALKRAIMCDGEPETGDPIIAKLLSLLSVEEPAVITERTENSAVQEEMYADNEDGDDEYDRQLPTPYKKTRKFVEETSNFEEQTKDNTSINLRALLSFNEKEDNEYVAESHGIKWYNDEHDITKTGIGKPIAPHQWRLKSQYNSAISIMEGSNKDQRIEPFDIFMMLFPAKQLQDMVRFTNQRLASLSEPKGPVTEGEILRFFGVLILGTFVEFDNRKDLWTKKSDSKYVPAPNFAKTGMSRDRFLTLFVHLRYSFQPDKKPAGMTHETYRWMLIDVSV